MQLTSLTHEDSTIILAGLYDVMFDFHVQLQRKLPPSLPTKKTKLPLVMLVTLILFKFFVGHRSWKEYYRYLKSHHHGITVGWLPSYRNFMVSMHKLMGYALVFLESVRKYCKQGVTLQFGVPHRL